jgi:thiamine-monophosphate kinase
MATEFERIARLRQLFQSAPSERIALGIGDDAAVLNPSSRSCVWTVDTAVEGVHFSRSFMGLEDVGYRAFMAAASDIAAMGGRAAAALCAWVLPSELTEAEFDRLAAGVARAAELCGCAVVGGNLARGNELSLTTTVLGDCHGALALRRGARPGDSLFVTGTLGGAALGLRALQAGRASEPLFATCVERFLRPRARLDVAEMIAARAHACIDVSDGLVQDLMHLCESSGVTAVIDLAAIPATPGMREGAPQLGAAIDTLLLAGGEDYELLFAANPARIPAELATPIGRFELGEPGVTVRGESGLPTALPAGFDHFR